MTDRIKAGSNITTVNGSFVAESFNGSIVYGKTYDGSELVSEDRYTLSEVGMILHEYDGKIHLVIWE